MILACQRDARALRGVFEVTRVEPREDGWHALLADTLLYPEGGGQPSDHGTVGGVAVTRLERAPGGVVHVLAGPIGTGPAEVVVDAARRADHCVQHSAQHLVTALAQDAFGWRTTSFHLHPGLGSACDIEVDATVDAAALPALEARVNAAIREARPVRAREVDADALTGVRSRGLPEGFTGPVRLVEIEGLDVNTCGGTHVANTAELGALALLSVERLRGGTRLAFVAGDRVLHGLRAAEAVLAEAGGLLSRGAAEVAEGVRRALDDARAAAKARDALAGELADALGAALLAEPGPVRTLHREDGDAAFLARVATAVGRRDPGALLWLTAGADAFLLAGPPERVAAVKPELLARLGARGGGPPGRLQGKAGDPARRGEIAAWLAASPPASAPPREG